MSDLDASREEALNLMAESLLRELGSHEEARLRKLLEQHTELQSASAAFQAMASSKALQHHEKTAALARQKFLDRAQSLHPNTVTKQSLLQRLWQSPRALGGGFLLAQLALLVMFVQVLDPLAERQASDDTPLYRGAQQVPCGDYVVSFKADANYAELFALMANSGISIVKGPSLSGQFELIAPGISGQDVREILKDHVSGFATQGCEAGQP